MRKPKCPRTLSRFSETFFLLSNQIHREFKTNQNILSNIFCNKIADSENVQPKQRLFDEEKTTLINFSKQNEALWSSEVNFQNMEEKSAVKEDLVSLFDWRFSEDFLDRNFHALRTGFNRQSEKQKDKAPKKKWKFFDKLFFLTEELEKAEKKVKFDMEERETLIGFFQFESSPAKPPSHGISWSEIKRLFVGETSWKA